MSRSLAVQRRQNNSAKLKSVPALLQSFNTWAYKREQPHRPEMLLARVERAVLDQTPIEMVLYWGKGPRDHRAAPDARCLDFLASMRDRIVACHQPGAQIHLILTDTHARHNGHTEGRIKSYFDEISDGAAARNFEHTRLSKLVELLPDRELINGSCEPDAPTLEMLMRSATKWYAGSENVMIGALKYFQMNMIERIAVERAFPDSIFVTFNGRESLPLFPEHMPIFFMYSLKKGFSVKPWFLGDTSEQAIPANLALVPKDQMTPESVVHTLANMTAAAANDLG